MCMSRVPAVFMLKHAYLWEDLLGLFAPGGKHKSLIWAPGAEAVSDAYAEHVLMRHDEDRQIPVSDNSIKSIIITGMQWATVGEVSSWAIVLQMADKTDKNIPWSFQIGAWF